ncbi:MAG: hypothetical protein R2745_03840 [Vicinamibacterales bacterium]
MTTGVNYPWRRYGGDFGPTVWGPAAGIRAHAVPIASDLAAIAAAGLEVVRWFVFTDARGGLALDVDGWPTGPHADAVADLDALFGLALAAGVRLVPVLFDHTLGFDASDEGGARLGGHLDWLADPDGQARLLDAVVAPLARRYGARGPRADLGRAVYAWDLLNEPDWLVAEMHPAERVGRPLPFDVLAAYLRAAAAEFHAHGDALVTLGGARLRFARWWDQASLGLDLLQAHCYYDPDHDFDLLDLPAGGLGLTRPIVVGECSALGDAADDRRGRPPLTVAGLARAARTRGFAGAWPWSWRGGDRHGALAAGDLAPLRAAHD